MGFYLEEDPFEEACVTDCGVLFEQVPCHASETAPDAAPRTLSGENTGQISAVQWFFRGDSSSVDGRCIGSAVRLPRHHLPTGGEAGRVDGSVSCREFA